MIVYQNIDKKRKKGENVHFEKGKRVNYFCQASSLLLYCLATKLAFNI